MRGVPGHIPSNVFNLDSRRTQGINKFSLYMWIYPEFNTTSPYFAEYQTLFQIGYGNTNSLCITPGLKAFQV